MSISVAQLPNPRVFAPTSEVIGEDTLLTFVNGQITLADALASGTSDSLTLSANIGTITLGSTTGLTFQAGSNKSPSMTVTGTLANLNAAA